MIDGLWGVIVEQAGFKARFDELTEHMQTGKVVSRLPLDLPRLPSS